MAVSIDLNHQAKLRTVEINNAAADWFLPGELIAEHSSAFKTVPKQNLRQDSLLSQIPEERFQFGIVVELHETVLLNKIFRQPKDNPLPPSAASPFFKGESLAGTSCSSMFLLSPIYPSLLAPHTSHLPEVLHQHQVAAGLIELREEGLPAVGGRRDLRSDPPEEVSCTGIDPSPSQRQDSAAGQSSTLPFARACSVSRYSHRIRV